jgi:hypothetical protein
MSADSKMHAAYLARHAVTTAGIAYAARPVLSRHFRPSGWIVAAHPVGAAPVAGRYRGPFAGTRARRKAGRVNRKAGTPA